MARQSTVIRLSVIAIRRIANYMARNCCGYIVRFLGCEIGLDFIYRRDDGVYMGVYSEGGVSRVVALTGMSARYVRKNADIPANYPPLNVPSYVGAYRDALIGAPASVMIHHNPNGPNYVDGRLLRHASISDGQQYTAQQLVKGVNPLTGEVVDRKAFLASVW